MFILFFYVLQFVISIMMVSFWIAENNNMKRDSIFTKYFWIDLFNWYKNLFYDYAMVNDFKEIQVLLATLLVLFILMTPNVNLIASCLLLNYMPLKKLKKWYKNIFKY